MAQRDGSPLLFAALSPWCLGLWVLACSTLFAWSFRDGLGGPDSLIESRGTLAFGRFWAGLWCPFVSFVVPCFVAGGMLYQRDLQDGDESDAAPDAADREYFGDP
jgi:hypothetical protein